MALAPNTRPAPFGAIATLNFVNLFENVVASVSNWNAKRKTQNILAALSDRELADIGLSRADLDNLPSHF
ncbi:DUF1127 domain-containing protein [Amylibacter sp. IMCC11727]|uniref:DUF1127 domain-containing protein n=1 Tax=Amylibacter sp. IMCC11727 TaxID=3039851 RepID=UPI00244DDF1E|nr:DUF1127 domain-containing protein [Amylibacter sp. IMCC11727]WGI22827.1 DUF1127 domain-containing protein [Amylibacter sp. IMCC11727]